MILPKVLKANEHRGIRIYIRRLGGETFEYLIPFKNQIYQNQVEINRKVGTRLKKYTEDELLGSVTIMQRTAELFIDDLLFQEEEYNRIRNRVIRIYGKVEQFIRNQITNLKTLNERIRKSKGLRGRAEREESIGNEKTDIQERV